MAREFSIVREMSRREVESHAKRFIGVTVTSPAFVVQDDNGLTEWVCDIRVGVKEGWAIVKNCLVTQWAIGVVTDINIPVTCERSDAGRVTIIARSEVALPDILLDTYEYEELGFSFMRSLIVQDDGSLLDGFGYEMAPAGTVTVGAGQTEFEAQNEAEAFGIGTQDRTIEFISSIIEWGSTDFEYGVTVLNAQDNNWEG